MTKSEFREAIESKYSVLITDCDEWIKTTFSDVPEDKLSKEGANYITQVVAITHFVETCFSGNYEDMSERPTKDKFAFDMIPQFQEWLFEIHYRVSLVNREVPHYEPKF